MLAQGKSAEAQPLPNPIGAIEEQMPGLNPVPGIGAAWKTYLGGQNPIDDYRGQPILSDNEFLAGGWDALKPMVEWTVNQGTGDFVRFDPRADTMTEMIAGGAPVLNSVLKFTDQGLREKQRATIDASQSEHARAMLDTASRGARTGAGVQLPGQSEAGGPHAEPGATP